jgi:hypothetical protein
MRTVKRDPKPTAARPRQARRAAPAAAPAIEAAADIDRVVELYCQELISKGYDDPEYWWWPRAVWADPNQLIVDGENGSLYRVAFSTNDQQEVTFADPVEVLETFTDLEPAAKARVLVSAARDTGSRAPSRVYASREDTPAAPKTEPEGGVDEGGNNVGMNREQLCAALGLPADATDEQIDAKTAELAAADPAEGGDGGQGGGEPDPAPAGEGGEGGEGGEPDPAPAASAQLPEGMVAVPADIWESVQTGAIAGGQLAEQAEVTNRDSTIVAATAAGKISPSAKESMVNLHARDKEAFYKLLTASVSEGGLAPNLIPVAQRGGAATATGATPGPGGGPGAMVPGGQVPAEAGGEYVPPERMVALFGKQYAPPAPDASGMTVIGAQ